MRIYLKRLILVFLVLVTTIGLLLFQTVYYFPPSVAKDSFDFKIRSEPELFQRHTNDDKILIHRSSSNKAHRTTTRAVTVQKPITKPLSHEELRYPFNGDYDNLDVINEQGFNNYLSSRKLKNKNIISLNNLPWSNMTYGQECRNWTVLGTFWKKRFK